MLKRTAQPNQRFRFGWLGCKLVLAIGENKFSLAMIAELFRPKLHSTHETVEYCSVTIINRFNQGQSEKYFSRISQLLFRLKQLVLAGRELV